MERGASGVRKGEGGAVGLDFAQVDMDVVGPLQMLSNVWSLEIPQLEEKSAFIRKGVSEGGGRVVSAHILTRFVCVCVYVCLCVCFHPLPPGGQGVQHCCICSFFSLVLGFQEDGVLVFLVVEVVCKGSPPPWTGG